MQREWALREQNLRIRPCDREKAAPAMIQCGLRASSLNPEHKVYQTLVRIHDHVMETYYPTQSKLNRKSNDILFWLVGEWMARVFNGKYSHQLTITVHTWNF